MGCLKLTNYKRKLPRRWTVLCQKIKTSMGEWLVTYNGENRPVKFTQGTKSIEMKYDYMGRRIQYVYKTGNTLNKDRRYMYNGYTLVQEMYNTNQVYMEFTWDPTAGTATKPLMLAFPTEGKNLFYFHDANKNVTEVAYMATHNGIGAHYEYDTFGNIITNTRNSLFNFDSNNINPFRFSSEYFDSELGLIYYNYRHYNPQSGRWLSRDPIEEIGGNNLYGMCKNNTLNLYDVLGKMTLMGSNCQGKTRLISVEDKIGYVIYHKECRTSEDAKKDKKPNGCSNPLGGFWNDIFEEACNSHDICYDTCGKEKKDCEGDFLSNMMQICSTNPHGISLLDCAEQALAYTAGVVSFGGDAFESAQDNNCVWKPCTEMWCDPGAAGGVILGRGLILW